MFSSLAVENRLNFEFHALQSVTGLKSLCLKELSICAAGQTAAEWVLHVTGLKVFQQFSYEVDLQNWTKSRFMKTCRTNLKHTENVVNKMQQVHKPES